MIEYFDSSGGGYGIVREDDIEAVFDEIGDESIGSVFVTDELDGFWEGDGWKEDAIGDPLRDQIRDARDETEGTAAGTAL